MPVNPAATFCATLVDEWVVAGVSAAMVAPGSRSTPMALALAKHPGIRLEIFHDERSASFAALGHGLATGRPAVVLCSSGTAGTHFHAAVVEADLSSVPMIVLTADRPPELLDVGAAQTIDQTHLFGRSVRWFHAPGVPGDDTARTWRSLARRTYRSSVDTRPGPVHLNLAFREPLVGDPGPLPAGEAHALVTSSPSFAPGALDALVPLLDRQRGVIVVGRMADGTESDVEAVEALSSATGWPVLADPRSGCRHLHAAVRTADSLLRHDGFARDHAPEVVLHIGEPWASRVVNEWLTSSGAFHVHLSSIPKPVDPGHVMSQWITAPVGSVCRWLAARLRGASGTTWATRWRRNEMIAREAIDTSILGMGVLTEPAVAQTVCRSMGENGGPLNLVLSSSMPIRDVEWYAPIDRLARVHANRGANGIDGVLASAIGVALAAGPTVLLIGDVAFLHDASSLTALRSREIDLRVVVVDNDGGGIFSFLSQAAVVGAERFEQLFGTPHGTDLLALCSAHGIAASTVHDIDGLLSALGRPGTSVTIVRSERASNVAAHQRINRAVHDALG